MSPLTWVVRCYLPLSSVATSARLLRKAALFTMPRTYVDILLPFDARVNTVAELAKQGYAEKMVLAHDAACYFDWFPPGAVAAAAPNWNYNHISDDVLPALRERGVSEDQITTMLVDNPRRYFEMTK